MRPRRTPPSRMWVPRSPASGEATGIKEQAAVVRSTESKAERKRQELESPDRCHDRALQLLSFRARSRSEMGERLLRVGFPEPMVTQELERLERVGLLNDEQFAEAFTREMTVYRGQGRWSVKAGLGRKGIDRQTIDEATASLTPELEEERADALAAVRARRLTKVEPRAAFQRLSGFLMRRGFDGDIARRAARRALAVELDEAE